MKAKLRAMRGKGYSRAEMLRVQRDVAALADKEVADDKARQQRSLGAVRRRLDDEAARARERFDEQTARLQRELAGLFEAEFERINKAAAARKLAAKSASSRLKTGVSAKALPSAAKAAPLSPGAPPAASPRRSPLQALSLDAPPAPAAQRPGTASATPSIVTPRQATRSVRSATAGTQRRAPSDEPIVVSASPGRRVPALDVGRAAAAPGARAGPASARAGGAGAPGFAAPVSARSRAGRAAGLSLGSRSAPATPRISTGGAGGAAPCGGGARPQRPECERLQAALRKAFTNALEAFVFFDISGSDSILRSELNRQLPKVSPCSPCQHCISRSVWSLRASCSLRWRRTCTPRRCTRSFADARRPQSPSRNFCAASRGTPSGPARNATRCTRH
jgi:hypothetical protein